MKAFYLSVALLGFSSPALLGQYFDLRDGNEKYAAGEYENAKQRYDKIIADEEKFENKKEAIFNSGNALYRQKKYDDAESDYRKIAENQVLDPSLRASAYYNIGNGYFNKFKEANPNEKESLLKEAVKNYKESLKLNPNDRDAKRNFEFANAALKQIEEQKKQGGNDKQENDKEENEKNKKDEKKDKQQDDKGKQEKDKQNQDKQEKGKQNQDKQDQQQENQNNQNSAQNKSGEEKKSQEGKEGQSGQAQISKADAEKLLDALKQDEKQMLKKYLMKKSNQIKYDKDW